MHTQNKAVGAGPVKAGDSDSHAEVTQDQVEVSMAELKRIQADYALKRQELKQNGMGNNGAENSEDQKSDMDIADDISSIMVAPN